ncbi:anthranilate synthase component I family protein [Rothia sp. LK2588]|uniref:anthranilate synthase component I family protein n=1 Tax=Rothia sp. LK2588 TaxID=3114369 RepID=UPI0034CE789D
MLSLTLRPLSVPVRPERVFTALTDGADYAFWLDSARNESPMSRFSYLGVVPDGADILRVEHASAAENPFAALERAAASAPQVQNAPAELRDELLGGYVGYFGYEARRALGFPAPHEAATPDALWMPALRYLIIENASGRAWLVGDEEWVESTSAWLDRDGGEMMGDLAAEPQPLDLDLTLPEREAYEAKIRECLHEIYEGNSYEVCLTAETRGRLPETLYNPQGIIDLYLAQRDHNAAPYAALLKCGDHWVLSSSPERFLTVDSTGAAETKPIKGTVPRASSVEEDRTRAAWLREDAKTRAENLMIVDLLRNDLSRVSEPGTIEVPVLMGVESYATVHQLVSTVRGRLRPGVGAVEAAAVCFPGGSMTGAPKPSTMQIIDRLEDRPRGIYSGALGFFSASGAANLSIVIRTLVVLPGGKVSLSAGGAIVADSDPGAEYDEMVTKLRAALPPSVARRSAR